MRIAIVVSAPTTPTASPVLMDSIFKATFASKHVILASTYFPHKDNVYQFALLNSSLLPMSMGLLFAVLALLAA